MISKVSVFVFSAAIIFVAAGCTNSQRQSGSIGLNVLTGTEVSRFMVSCSAENRQRLEIDAGSVVNNKSLLEQIIESDVEQLKQSSSGDKLTKSQGEGVLTVAASQSELDKEVLTMLFEKCFIFEETEF